MISEMISLAVLSKGSPQIYFLDESSWLESAKIFSRKGSDMERIPHELLDLFEKPSLAHLATLMPDGSPHVSPVWVDYDGQHILINTAKGRRKEANMRERPRVALDIVDPENPFRFLSIQGRVVEMTEKGADEHRDRLDTRYLGITQYPQRNPQEIRLICKILPEWIIVNH